MKHMILKLTKHPWCGKLVDHKKHTTWRDFPREIFQESAVSEFVHGAIGWGRTPEGLSYWARIYENLSENGY